MPSIARNTWRHYALQLLCLFQHTPRLRLTRAACEELRAQMARVTAYEPVATILWSNSAVMDKPHSTSGWSIAFYNLNNRPYGRVVRFEGIPFIFIQRDSAQLLDGATLDVSEGCLVVTAAQPPQG